MTSKKFLIIWAILLLLGVVSSFQHLDADENTIAVGMFPSQLEIAHGQVLVLNTGNFSEADHTLSVIDIADFTFVDDVYLHTDDTARKNGAVFSMSIDDQSDYLYYTINYLTSPAGEMVDGLGQPLVCRVHYQDDSAAPEPVCLQASENPKYLSAAGVELIGNNLYFTTCGMTGEIVDQVAQFDQGGVVFLKLKPFDPSTPFRLDSSLDELANKRPASRMAGHLIEATSINPCRISNHGGVLAVVASGRWGLQEGRLHLYQLNNNGIRLVTPTPLSLPGYLGESVYDDKARYLYIGDSNASGSFYKVSIDKAVDEAKMNAAVKPVEFGSPGTSKMSELLWVGDYEMLYVIDDQGVKSRLLVLKRQMVDDGIQFETLAEFNIADDLVAAEEIMQVSRFAQIDAWPRKKPTTLFVLWHTAIGHGYVSRISLDSNGLPEAMH